MAVDDEHGVAHLGGHEAQVLVLAAGDNGAGNVGLARRCCREVLDY